MRYLGTLMGIILCSTSLCAPLAVAAETEINAGFIQGIWYASPTVAADTPTRIYVAFRNNSTYDLTGTVRFTANDRRVGTSYVSALPGRIVEAWTDWTPSEGTYTVTATLYDVKLLTPGEQPRFVELESMLAQDSVTVLKDTDQDNTPDERDGDDDNDGVSDEEERTRGTDPRTPNQGIIKNSEERSVPLTQGETESEAPQGLEQFVGSGIIKDTLRTTTQKMLSARDVVEEYRRERREESVSTSTPSLRNAEHASTTSPTAGIGVRFMTGLVGGVAHLFSLITSVVLWSTSFALGHPALLQVLLLLGIVIIVYRLARRLGRRPFD